MHLHLGCFVEHYTGQQQLLRSFDIGFIVRQGKKHELHSSIFKKTVTVIAVFCCIELCSLSTNTLTIFLL